MTAKDKKEILDYVVKELKYYKKDLYHETESALKNYAYNKIMIEKNDKRIKEIWEKGLTDQIKKVTMERVSGGKVEYKGVPEKEIDTIEYLQKENMKLEKRIIRIENALECIKNEPNYKILEMRYFNKYTLEEIEIEIGLSIKTIRNHLKKMIKILQNLIFQEILFQEIS